MRYPTILSFLALMAVLGVGVTASAETEVGLKVYGEGLVKLDPNVADLQVYFQEEERNASTAQRALARNTEPVLRQWRNLSDDVKIITEQVQVYPQTRWSNGRSETVSYRARLQVQIKGIPIEDSGEWLERISEAEVHRLARVHYRHTSSDRQRHPALVEAIQDARAKAEIVAEAAGVQLRHPVSIVEQSGPARAQSQPMLARGATMGAAESVSAQIELQPEAQEYRARVSVRYSIAP